MKCKQPVRHHPNPKRTDLFVPSGTKKPGHFPCDGDLKLNLSVRRSCHCGCCSSEDEDVEISYSCPKCGRRFGIPPSAGIPTGRYALEAFLQRFLDEID